MQHALQALGGVLKFYSVTIPPGREGVEWRLLRIFGRKKRFDLIFLFVFVGLLYNSEDMCNIYIYINSLISLKKNLVDSG